MYDCTGVADKNTIDLCIACSPIYRITRMFCEHQTFANFAMVDQFATIKSAKPKLLLVSKYTRSLPERNS